MAQEALNQLGWESRATPSWDRRELALLAWEPCAFSVIPEIGKRTGRRANQTPMGQKPVLRKPI